MPEIDLIAEYIRQRSWITEVAIEALPSWATCSESITRVDFLDSRYWAPPPKEKPNE